MGFPERLGSVLKRTEQSFPSGSLNVKLKPVGKDSSAVGGGGGHFLLTAPPSCMFRVKAEIGGGGRGGVRRNAGRRETRVGKGGWWWWNGGGKERGEERGECVTLLAGTDGEFSCLPSAAPSVF